VFYEKGLAGCVPSTLAAMRLLERKHELLGMNSAVKVDIISVTTPQQPTRYERIQEAIMRVARPERFQQPNGGDGAVDVANDNGSDPATGDGSDRQASSGCATPLVNGTGHSRVA
jgi:hypothetical protein